MLPLKNLPFWARKLTDYYRRHGAKATIGRLREKFSTAKDYSQWVVRYDTLSLADCEAIRASIAVLAAPPLISVVMPVYNTPEPWLRRALDSVIGQLYPHWQLCVADDASTDPGIATLLADYAARDSRILWQRRSENGHISAASNTALELATGDFFALMDHDDELPPHTLYYVAVEILAHPDADLIYSDEDKIDEQGQRHNPYFKPDWNPDLFYAQNMISHLGVYRRDLVMRLGGFRLGYEGSQDYDLALRVIAASTPTRIRHIPRILYHWRVFPTSRSFSSRSLDVAVEAGRQAVRDHFATRGITATVLPAPNREIYARIVYPVPTPLPLVSIIIPMRDKVELLRDCLDGILHHTDYAPVEIIVVDNDSRAPETSAYFASLADEPRVKIVPYPGVFNYSALNNFGVAQSAGSLLCFLNNDIKVMQPGWLTELVSQVLRPEVGAVGAKLYYADGSIQHAGIVAGMSGVAAHIARHFPGNHYGYHGSLVVARDVSAVTGACLMTRRAVFDEIGGFDAVNLAVAYNDVDLCLRIREKGYLIVWTPWAELYHLESSTRGRDASKAKFTQFMNETTYMQRRWKKVLTADPCHNPNLTLERLDYSVATPPRVRSATHADR